MSLTAPPNRPEAIAAFHRVAAFRCGAPELDQYLARFALTNHRSGAAKTFVATTAGNIVVGYYSLAASQILHADAPARIRLGLPRHPVPVVLLARLAVDQPWQHQGIGAALLKDAILRVLGAAEGIGVRALLVHAKDEAAKAFYLRYDFEPLPGFPLHLALLLKDARKIVAGSQP